MDLTLEMLAGFDAALAGVYTCPYFKSSPAWAAYWFGHGVGRRGAWLRGTYRKVSQSRGYTLRVVYRSGETATAPWPGLAEVQSLQSRMTEPIPGTDTAATYCRTCHACLDVSDHDLGCQEGL